MIRRIRGFVGLVLRGYGQLFLCNRVSSGGLFLAALTLISPRASVLALAGAVLVTGLSRRLCRRTALLRSGLFGVNGVLLGTFWILHPEVGFGVALAATAVGSVLLAGILVPVTTRLQRRASPFTVFSLPAVLVFWLLLSGMGATGHSDRALTRGWGAFFRQSNAEARVQFQAVESAHPRVRAHRRDGLGWIAFREGQYREAAEHFRRAIELENEWSDPRDGAGWTALRLGDLVGARGHFLASLELDPFKGSSWDGLGWCHLLPGDPGSAKPCFRKAAWSTPLFHDPYSGLARCAELEGGDPTGLRRAQTRLLKLAGTPLMVLPVFTLVGWVFFLAGVLVHSRLSAGVLLLTFGLHLLIRRIPAFSGPMDVNFFYNLAALALALGGAYLVLSPSVLVVLGAVTLLLQASWPLWQALLPAGWPVLCLPFNLLLLAALGVLSLFRGRLGLRTVPLELAVTTPGEVLWWDRKRRLVEECWRGT